MATYNSDQILANSGLTPLQGPRVFAGPGPAGTLPPYVFNVVLTAAPTVSDVINFGVVPKGFRLTSAQLEASDLDTGSTVTINVGDAGSANRIFAASTVGQAGTVSPATASSGIGYQYTEDTMITGALAAGPGTNGGSLTLVLNGRFEGLPT